MPSLIWRRCALLLVVSGTLQAEPGSAPAVASMPELTPTSAAVLAGVCVSCHGPGGHSQTVIPGFAGQPEERLRARLLSFRDGTAPDATIMTRLMKGYDEVQIAALARWFAQGQ